MVGSIGKTQQNKPPSHADKMPSREELNQDIGSALLELIIKDSFIDKPSDEQKEKLKSFLMGNKDAYYLTPFSEKVKYGLPSEYGKIDTDYDYIKDMGSITGIEMANSLAALPDDHPFKSSVLYKKLIENLKNVGEQNILVKKGDKISFSEGELAYKPAEINPAAAKQDIMKTLTTLTPEQIRKYDLMFINQHGNNLLVYLLSEASNAQQYTDKTIEEKFRADYKIIEAIYEKLNNDPTSVTDKDIKDFKDIRSKYVKY